MARPKGEGGARRGARVGDSGAPAAAAPRPAAAAAPAAGAGRGGAGRRLRRWLLRGAAGLVLAVLGLVAAVGVIDPPQGLYMRAEAARLGAPVRQEWVPIEAMSPHMLRAAIAAEDANFCRHWGFDMGEIRRALDAGGTRGASTITQQTVKNVFLWHGRSWGRKALEALLTPVVEATWSKRRILEVYLNVAEFGEGIFGVEAAARHHFRRSAAQLTAEQAARLAAILPDPKRRSPTNPSAFVRRRAAAILSGAGTIAADGRDRCVLAPA